LIDYKFSKEEKTMFLKIPVEISAKSFWFRLWISVSKRNPEMPSRPLNLCEFVWGPVRYGIPWKNIIGWFSVGLMIASALTMVFSVGLTTGLVSFAVTFAVGSLLAICAIAIRRRLLGWHATKKIWPPIKIVY